MRTVIKPAVPIEINGKRYNWEDSEEYIRNFSDDLVNEITNDWNEKEKGFRALA